MRAFASRAREGAPPPGLPSLSEPARGARLDVQSWSGRWNVEGNGPGPSRPGEEVRGAAASQRLRVAPGQSGPITLVRARTSFRCTSVLSVTQELGHDLRLEPRTLGGDEVDHALDLADGGVPTGRHLQTAL